MAVVKISSPAKISGQSRTRLLVVRITEPFSYRAEMRRKKRFASWRPRGLSQALTGAGG